MSEGIGIGYVKEDNSSWFVVIVVAVVVVVVVRTDVGVLVVAFLVGVNGVFVALFIEQIRGAEILSQSSVVSGFCSVTLDIYHLCNKRSAPSKP